MIEKERIINRSIQISVSLPKDMIEQMDEAKWTLRKSRSEIAKEAIEQYLKDKEKKDGSDK